MCLFLLYTDNLMKIIIYIFFRHRGQKVRLTSNKFILDFSFKANRWIRNCPKTLTNQLLQTTDP